MQPITENHSFDDVDFVFHDAQKQYNKCGEILRSNKNKVGWWIWDVLDFKDGPLSLWERSPQFRSTIYSAKRSGWLEYDV